MVKSKHCREKVDIQVAPAALSGSQWKPPALPEVTHLAKLPDDFAFKKQWPGVKAIGMAIRITKKSDGTTSEDVRYFIASRYLSGKRFAQSVRGHWAIENSLHWVLDVTFNEDQSRARERHLAGNLSWLRRFGISLLKQHPSKDSVKGKSQIAGWSNDFLMQVLAAQRT